MFAFFLLPRFKQNDLYTKISFYIVLAKEL